MNDKLQSTIEPNCLPTISHFSLSQLVIINLVIFGNIGINMNIYLNCMHLCIHLLHRIDIYTEGSENSNKTEELAKEGGDYQFWCCFGG